MWKHQALKIKLRIKTFYLKIKLNICFLEVESMILNQWKKRTD